MSFSFLFHLLMKIMSANRKAPDGTPHFSASHLGLFCLPMSHKKDARLIYGLNKSYLLSSRLKWFFFTSGKTELNVSLKKKN